MNSDIVRNVHDKLDDEYINVGNAERNFTEWYMNFCPETGYILYIRHVGLLLCFGYLNTSLDTFLYEQVTG